MRVAAQIRAPSEAWNDCGWRSPRLDGAAGSIVAPGFFLPVRVLAPLLWFFTNLANSRESAGSDVDPVQLFVFRVCVLAMPPDIAGPHSVRWS